MAFGLNTETSSEGGGGDFLPRIKFKANAGRWILCDSTYNDRTGEWDKSERDITRDLEKEDVSFAMDFGSVEIGWGDLGGAKPVKFMAPAGQPRPPKPDTKRANDQGRMVDAFQENVSVKLAGRIMRDPEGKFVREWEFTAKTVKRVFEDLHTEFEAAPEAVAGKIPLVRYVDCTESKVETKKGTNTFYAPIFRIVGWTERNADMLGPRTVPPPAGAMKPLPGVTLAPAGRADDGLDQDIPF